MHDSYIYYAFLCMSRIDWREDKQLASHWKYGLIIQIELDSFLSEQKAYKITRIFFSTNLLSPSKPSFLSRKLIYAICIWSRYSIVPGEFFTNVICISLACSEKYTYMTSGIIYILSCTLFLYCSGMFLKVHLWRQG